MQLKLFVLSALIACTFGVATPDGLIPVRQNGRIVGGTNIPITTAPWQLALIYFGSHRCGASLVYNSVAISSAACVIGTIVDNLLVRGGSANVFEGLTYAVSSYHTHPNFDAATYDYDVSVVYLEYSIDDFSDYLNAVPLAYPGYPLTAGSLISISGWGATAEGGSFATQLQGAVIPIIDQEVCNEAYRDYGGLTPRQFCAGFLPSGGVDVCTGDGGGPATISDTLVGIASWGYACGQPGFPGVYISIPAVREWLDQMLV